MRLIYQHGQDSIAHFPGQSAELPFAVVFGRRDACQAFFLYSQIPAAQGAPAQCGIALAQRIVCFDTALVPCRGKGMECWRERATKLDMELFEDSEHLRHIRLALPLPAGGIGGVLSAAQARCLDAVHLGHIANRCSVSGANLAGCECNPSLGWKGIHQIFQPTAPALARTSRNLQARCHIPGPALAARKTRQQCEFSSGCVCHAVASQPYAVRAA